MVALLDIEAAAKLRAGGLVAFPTETVYGLGADAANAAAITADPALTARQLYARLREADALGVEAILVIAPPSDGLGLAIRDRLSRAAGLCASQEEKAIQ